jgi:RNA polymerase sigma-70 factor, ECF subfamily
VHPIFIWRRITRKQQSLNTVQPRPESRSPIPFPGGSVVRSGLSDGLDTGVDVRLIAQIADGQTGALSELYRRRGGALFRFLQRILGEDPDAEEILQDAFVAIWRRAGGYDPAKSGPLTWMMMIARGLALDRLRQRSRRLSGFERLKASNSGVGAGADTASTHLEADEQARRLGSALCSLPETQRTAIEMAFYRGCTQEEIAQATGEPLGTIKARIRRGMLSLRLRLQNRHE